MLQVTDFHKLLGNNFLNATKRDPFVPGASGARISTTQVLEAGINEDAISLYPNPASGGRFTILLPENTENAVVRIYDNLGRMLYEKIAKGGNRIEIDARLKAGFYHVRINSKGVSFTKKLIVK